MLGFRRKEERSAAVSVQTRPAGGRAPLPVGAGERELYRALRQSVPIIDAAIYKMRRLIGDFKVRCPDQGTQERLQRLLDRVQVNAGGTGINEFLGIYLEELITYYSQCDEPTLVVFFGDHQPPLANAFYEAL